MTSPFRYVERGEQGRRAVAFIVMRHGSDPSLLHRQAGLGAVKRLNLALFVDAEHQRVIEWVHIEANHILQLLDKIGWSPRYLYHRISLLLDGKPLLIPCDDGWRALIDPTFRCARRSWRDPAGASPAQVRGSARLVVSVASAVATPSAKRTQQSSGVG